MAMETMSEALERLGAAGYADDFRAAPDGLRAGSNGGVHPAAMFRVDEVVRFEGESDPSEEAAIFALTCAVDGSKGTYTVAFGLMMDALDAEIVKRLSSKRT